MNENLFLRKNNNNNEKKKIFIHFFSLKYNSRDDTIKCACVVLCCICMYVRNINDMHMIIFSCNICHTKADDADEDLCMLLIYNNII